MLRSLCSCGNERKVDIGGHCAGQLFLSLLSCFLQSLHSHLITGQIYAFCLLEFIQHPLNDLVIEIITAKVCITVGSQYFDDTVTDLDDRYIKGTATKVVYHDLLFFFIVQTISKCCCGRLVDDTLYIQACDLTCILGSLTLGIIEVCGNCDNCLGNLLTQIALGICFQLLQDHCGDLLRRVFFAVNGTAAIGTHISLNGRNGLLCVGNCLTLCRLTDQSLTGLGKCYNRGCSSCAFCISDNGGLTTFHNSYTAVGCT